MLNRIVISSMLVRVCNVFRDSPRMLKIRYFENTVLYLGLELQASIVETRYDFISRISVNQINTYFITKTI